MNHAGRGGIPDSAPMPFPFPFFVPVPLKPESLDFFESPFLEKLIV